MVTPHKFSNDPTLAACRLVVRSRSGVHLVEPHIPIEIVKILGNDGEIDLFGFSFLAIKIGSKLAQGYALIIRLPKSQAKGTYWFEGVMRRQGPIPWPPVVKPAVRAV